MKKYPFILQDESKECGVACIMMIIKYYKGFVKKSTLLDMSKTNKFGTTAYDIKNTLINLGFDSKGISIPLLDINKDNVILPCIANVTIDNSFKHYIVIYEINFNKKYLIIADPSDKLKKISYEEFNKIYNNVLITFYPITQIPLEKNIPINKFLFTLIKPNKKIIFNICILSIFITLFSIMTSFYYEYMINAIGNYSKKYLLYIFGIFFSIYLLKIITEYFRNKTIILINQKINLVLTMDVFKKIIKLPYCYYKNRTTGDVITRINDLENIKDMISKVSVSIFIDLPLTLISLIILYLLNHTLFYIGVLLIFLYFIIIILFRNKFNENIRNIKLKKSNVTSFMIESISGYETVKGCNIEKYIIDKFENKYVSLIKNIFKYENLYFAEKLLKDFIDNIGYIIIILVGCILVIESKFEIGKLLTFSSLLIYFLEPIKNIISLDQLIKESKQSLKRILDIIVYDVENNSFINEFTMGDIDIKNLNYSFNDRDYILKNINMNISSGSKVMIYGKSGSGKSTLFKLLMRYYDIKNSIYISNIDISNYEINTLRENVLYIGQNEILFNDTLYNNIVLNNNNEKKLLNVCEICCINDMLDKNLGLNMLVEENGLNFSGGERQRIILARMLMKNFNILIIDEGLSQVDISLENKILKNLFDTYKDKTIIVISHRFDNSNIFDKLINFDNLVKGV